MIATGVFTIAGMIAGGFSAVLVTYIIHFILLIPNIHKSPSDLSEFIGLLHAFVILAIFESFKLLNRKFFRNKRPLKIGIIGAIFISIFVSTTVIYATTQTELYITKKDLIKNAKAINYKITDQKIEKYVNQKMNNGRHTFFLFAVLVSCFISLWTTMPNRLKRIINLAGDIGIIEKTS